jgi:hypothetical protein
MKLLAFWDIAPCCVVIDRRHKGNQIIALMMEIVYTSETSVHYKTTRRNVPEGYHLLIYLNNWQGSNTKDLLSNSRIDLSV